MTGAASISGRVIAVLAGVVLLLGAGCTRRTSSNVLAVVGDKEITEEDFTRHLEAERARSPVAVDPEVLLQELVEREVLAQKAMQAGLMDDPEVRELMRDVLIAKYKERHLSQELEAVTVSDEEVRAAYDREQDGLTRPEQVRLAILFAAMPPGEKQSGSEEARLRLEAAVQLARQQDLRSDKGDVQGFGPLAVNHSEDQESRYRGGEIGWVERRRFPGRFDAAVIEAGFALTEPGQVSGLISTSGGCYVVKLLERKQATIPPYEQAEPALRSRLLTEKRAQLHTQLQDKLRQNLRIEMHPERLATLAVASPAKPTTHPPLP